MKCKHVCDRCGDQIPKGSLACALTFGYRGYGKRKRHYRHPCSCRIAEAVETEECGK